MNHHLLRLLAHPLLQVLSFCIILVGSPYFGGPYLYFILGSVKEGYLYGILGIIGITLALLSLWIKAKRWTQLLSLILMLSSISVFFFSSSWQNATITLLNLPALFTLILFLFVSVAVSIKIFRWKNS